MSQQPAELLPDFGHAVWRQIGNEPFNLAIFSAGRIQVAVSPQHQLWSITLTPSSYHLEPAILLTELHILTLELPYLTQEQAFAFADRVQAGETLMLQVRQERKYWTELGEWVYPVYPIAGEADLQHIAKAKAKRQRRAARNFAVASNL